MKLRYKYRIYPNIEQTQHLIQAGGSCRYIWNKFLERNQESSRIAKWGVLACFEDLNIAQMKKNHPVAIAIGDAGWLDT